MAWTGTNLLYKIWGSHGGVGEDLRLRSLTLYRCVFSSLRFEGSCREPLPQRQRQIPEDSNSQLYYFNMMIYERTETNPPSPHVHFLCKENVIVSLFADLTESILKRCGSNVELLNVNKLKGKVELNNA
jgi:hypothetical protein